MKKCDLKVGNANDRDDLCNSSQSLQVDPSVSAVGIPVGSGSSLSESCVLLARLRQKFLRTGQGRCHSSSRVWGDIQG
jgi:hypothetical protein